MPGIVLHCIDHTVFWYFITSHCSSSHRVLLNSVLNGVWEAFCSSVSYYTILCSSILAVLRDRHGVSFLPEGGATLTSAFLPF